MTYKFCMKTDERLEGFDIIRGYVNDVVEIQLFGNELKLPKVITDLVKLGVKEITIHPAMSHAPIEIVLQGDRYKEVEQFIIEISKIQKELNVKINVLFHINTIYDKMIEIGILGNLELLKNLVEKTQVTVLLENGLLYYDYVNQRNTLMEVLQKLDSSMIQGCIDICHLHCTANMCRRSRKEMLKVLKEGFNSDLIRQVHFAGVWNNDGISDIRTHARNHVSIKELKEDLDILDCLDVNDKNIILEIREDDYAKRDSLMKEVNLLKELGYM